MGWVDHPVFAGRRLSGKGVVIAGVDAPLQHVTNPGLGELWFCPGHKGFEPGQPGFVQTHRVGHGGGGIIRNASPAIRAFAQFDQLAAWGGREIHDGGVFGNCHRAGAHCRFNLVLSLGFGWQDGGHHHMLIGGAGIHQPRPDQMLLARIILGIEFVWKDKHHMRWFNLPILPRCGGSGKGVVVAGGLHPKLRKAAREGLESQLQELRESLNEYEALRAGTQTSFEYDSLTSVPEGLIKARIARGMTQKQLAESLNLQEQQIQRYEATLYKGAALERIEAVAKVLGLRETVRFELG